MVFTNTEKLALKLTFKVDFQEKDDKFIYKKIVWDCQNSTPLVKVEHYSYLAF